jgi:hypothetical protein
VTGIPADWTRARARKPELPDSANRSAGHRSESMLDWLLPGQRILVDDAVFHDDFKIVGGVRDQVDVL